MTVKAVKKLRSLKMN